MRRWGLLLVLAILIISACQPPKPSLETAILGNWVNASGYTIEFKSGGDGFIPGVAGKVPATTFKYSIVDQEHVLIDLGSEKYTIQITVDGDKLTWTDKIGVETYTRVKQ
jgi:hypothetical protein